MTVVGYHFRFRKRLLSDDDPSPPPATRHPASRPPIVYTPRALTSHAPFFVVDTTCTVLSSRKPSGATLFPLLVPIRSLVSSVRLLANVYCLPISISLSLSVPLFASLLLVTCIPTFLWQEVCGGSTGSSLIFPRLSQQASGAQGAVDLGAAVVTAVAVGPQGPRSYWREVRQNPLLGGARMGSHSCCAGFCAPRGFVARLRMSLCRPPCPAVLAGAVAAPPSSRG